MRMLRHLAGPAAVLAIGVLGTLFILAFAGEPVDLPRWLGGLAAAIVVLAALGVAADEATRLRSYGGDQD